MKYKFALGTSHRFLKVVIARVISQKASIDNPGIPDKPDIIKTAKYMHDIWKEANP